MKPDLNGLTVFWHVAQERSFRKAAARLGVSPSALSHAMARLEEELGVRLVNRTTRSVFPSAAGARLLERLGPALSEIDAALDGLNHERTQLRGQLRLHVPRAAAQLVLAPRLAQWARSYPQVTLEVTSSDAVVDIVALGCDAGMRFGALLQQDMIALPVGPAMRFVVCAAPAYLEAWGAPDTPAALARHQCLQLRFPSGALYRWEFVDGAQALAVATPGSLVLDDFPTLMQAALDGAGLFYAYHAYAAPYIERGLLRPVLEASMPPAEHFYLYYPSRRHMTPALRALVDFLK